MILVTDDGNYRFIKNGQTLSLSEGLKLLRSEHGATELAKVCGASHRTIEGWIYERFEPNRASMLLLESWLRRRSWGG